MERVIEIESFGWKLKQFLSERHAKCDKLTVKRYFECLEIEFSSGPKGSPTRAAILPRVNQSQLAFQVSANILGGSEDVEKQLAEDIADFFTHECAGSGSVVEPIPDKATLLFFCEAHTLLLRIAG